jgi:hypothetical protein
MALRVKRDLVLDHKMSTVTGRCIKRGATDFLDTYGVRMILIRNPAFPNGFQILTAMAT